MLGNACCVVLLMFSLCGWGESPVFPIVKYCFCFELFTIFVISSFKVRFIHVFLSHFYDIVVFFIMLQINYSDTYSQRRYFAIFLISV